VCSLRSQNETVVASAAAVVSAVAFKAAALQLLTPPPVFHISKHPVSALQRIRVAARSQKLKTVGKAEKCFGFRIWLTIRNMTLNANSFFLVFCMLFVVD